MGANEIVKTEDIIYQFLVITHNIDCTIDELDKVISEVEKEPDFLEWIYPPLEQLNHILGEMKNPKKDYKIVSSIKYRAGRWR